MLCWIFLLWRVSSKDLEAIYHRKVFRCWNFYLYEYVNMILGPIKCYQDECFPYVPQSSVGSVVGGPWESEVGQWVGSVRQSWASHSPFEPAKVAPLQSGNSSTVFIGSFAVYKLLSRMLSFYPPSNSILLVNSALFPYLIDEEYQAHGNSVALWASPRNR